MKGVFYMHGRDQRFRPIIFIDVSKIHMKEVKIEEILQAMTYFFEYILKFTMLPGQIENWVVVMDLNKIGVSSLPISALRSVMTYLSSNYRSRMFATYVINTPGSIFIPWNIIKGFLEETTIQKISFFKNSHPDKLFTHAHKSQIEQKFGGAAPNTSVYWPPKEISKEYQLNEIETPDLFIAQKEYYDRWESGKLKNNIVCHNYLQSRHNKVPMNQIHVHDVETSVINLSSSNLPANPNLIIQNNQEITKSQFYRIDSAPKSQTIRPKNMSESISQLVKSSIKPQQVSTSKESEAEKQPQHQEQQDNFLNLINKRDSVQGMQIKGNSIFMFSSQIKIDKSDEGQINDQHNIESALKSNQQTTNASMTKIIASDPTKSIQLNVKNFQQSNWSQDSQIQNRIQKEIQNHQYPIKELERQESSVSISIIMDIPSEKMEYQQLNLNRNIRTNIRNGRSIMDTLNCITNYKI